MIKHVILFFRRRVFRFEGIADRNADLYVDVSLAVRWKGIARIKKKFILGVILCFEHKTKISGIF